MAGACKDFGFAVGDRVCVKQSYPGRPPSMWRRPHLPVPGKLEATGRVVKKLGMRSDPMFFTFCEELGLAKVNKEEPCYVVEFPLPQGDLTKKESCSDATKETICIEVFQSWLQREASCSDGISVPPGPSRLSPKAVETVKAPKRRSLKQSLKTLTQDMHDSVASVGPKGPTQPHKKSELQDHSDHGSHGNEDHRHLPRWQVEQAAVEKEGVEVPGQRLTEALLEILTSKKLIAKTAVARAIEVIESLGVQPLGPIVVVNAWMDENFKQRLLEDANAAIQSLNLEASSHVKVKVVESTETVHNLVVCTLCSCYPVSLLGLSPSWYKSRDYRIQAVERPRELLKESFGLEIPSNVEIRVHDSNADLRHLVLPKRPAGTEGWLEEDLMALVTRDTMIGVAVPEV